MNPEKIFTSLGISEYPASFVAFFSKAKKDPAPACDLDLIGKLEEEFHLFGQYIDPIRKAANQINLDPDLSFYVKAASLFAKDSPLHKARRLLPIPETDGSLKRNFLPLFVLIPLLPSVIENYRKRGFSEEEITHLLQEFQESIGKVKAAVGIAGVDARYYAWLTLYAKGNIFSSFGLNFAFGNLPENAFYLQNKKTGILLPVVACGTFHRSGKQVLGSLGYEDPEGSFTASFEEDDSFFYGHGVFDNAVSQAKERFSKLEWTCVLRPGDEILSFHIPAGADLSSENLDRAFQGAKQIAAERFPEKNVKGIHTATWLLCPQLEEILGDQSKIVLLMRRFAKHPIRSSGKEVFKFVFLKRTDDYTTLPEDTSLQRKLKQIYLDGGCIHGYAGVILF